MKTIFKYLLLVIIAAALIQQQANAQAQQTKDTLSISALKASILPTFSPLISLEEKPLPWLTKAKYIALMPPCLFTGTVLHQNGPSTFNTIWISGAGKNNKAMTVKTLTNEDGKYQANLSPGKYKIEVYGTEGVAAKVIYNLVCATPLLPQIKYKK